MDNNQPVVSIIIPVYNGERYLGEAIASVLAQDYRCLEIIVVDDGSTDATAQIAQRFGRAIAYVDQAHQGASEARNYGVHIARAEFLAFLDADDLWAGGKLQRQMQALITDPELSMVFGQVEQFYSPEVSETALLPALADRRLLAGLHVGAMLIRRTAFEQVGYFDPQWQVAHFIEWYTRAQKMGLKSLMLPEVVMQRRIHTTNLGIRAYTQARVEYVRLMKAIVDQRRLAKNNKAL